jgi:CheY-like chemotaxis protein
MFSRKNVMQLKPLHLSEVVGNMSKMLHRILGETITLEFNPPPDLPPVEADAGMIEQVVMNLCVNARDAMLKGGTLTINLCPIIISEHEVHLHPDARPGQFICVRVTDTGCGMDNYTLNRIFEPFFTTKEVGKGTGLGLATVYGIVKQHEGWIEVTSELGKGTTFNVFLPPCAESVENAQTESNPVAFVRGGSETILIVEDEPVLRDLAHLILEECGYRIYDAGSGPEALDVWDHHHDEIDLLLTDMVMPEKVSGVELAEKLLAQKSALKIVFVSGYTVDDVSTAFLCKNNNARFLQKPYNRTNLSRTIREALDGVAAPPPLETTPATPEVEPEHCMARS